MATNKRRRPLRPAGEIFLELEALLEELIDDHGFQWGDVLSNIWQWLVIHRPAAREVYLADGSSPVYSYGPKKDGTQ